MAFVLVPAYAILGPYLSDHPALALRWMGTLLVIGVMVVVVLSIFKELMSDRVMTKVALVSRLVSGFFKRQSALLPTALGLALLGGGGYGLLVLSNYEGADWLLYAAVAGGGLYVLKRTFSVADEIDLLHGPLPLGWVYRLASHGFTTSAVRSAKCLRFLVASAARRAITIPAI